MKLMTQVTLYNEALTVCTSLCLHCWKH